MRSGLDRLQADALLALSHDTFWLEIAIGAITLCWAGCVWWMPGDLVDLQSYATVARFAPDWVLEAMALTSGIVAIAAALRRHRLPRWLISVVLGAFWFAVTHGVSTQAPAFTPGIVANYGVSAMAGICVALPIIRRLLPSSPGR